MSEFKDGLKPIRVGIEGVSYSLTHVPDLVRYGSKPLREIRAQPALGEQLAKRLRDFAAATAYAPHQVYIGNIAPEKLSDLPKPWYERLIDRATRVVVVSNRHIEKRHDGVADVFIDKRAVFHQHVGGHAQKRIDHLMGFFRAEVLRHFGKRREVRKENRDFHHPALFDVRAAARADIWIARAALYAESAIDGAGGAREHRAADAALSGKLRMIVRRHGKEK